MIGSQGIPTPVSWRAAAPVAALLLLAACQGISPAVRQAQAHVVESATLYRQGYQSVGEAYLRDLGLLLAELSAARAREELRAKAAGGQVPLAAAEAALDADAARRKAAAERVAEIARKLAENEDHYRRLVAMAEDVAGVLEVLERRKRVEDRLQRTGERAAREAGKAAAKAATGGAR